MKRERKREGRGEERGGEERGGRQTNTQQNNIQIRRLRPAEEEPWQIHTKTKPKAISPKTNNNAYHQSISHTTITLNPLGERDCKELRLHFSA